MLAVKSAKYFQLAPSKVKCIEKLLWLNAKQKPSVSLRVHSERAHNFTRTPSKEQTRVSFDALLVWQTPFHPTLLDMEASFGASTDD